MNRIKQFLFISLSISSIGFLGLHAYQTYQNHANQKDLKLYYSRELEELYTNGYAVDQNGNLIWSQYRFETAAKELEEKMLTDGFNREQIRQMEDEGRSKGQERRSFWDNYYAQKEEEHEKRNP